jgi:hypothetical protein
MGFPWRATGSNDFEHKFKKLGAFCIIAKFKVVVVSYSERRAMAWC